MKSAYKLDNLNYSKMNLLIMKKYLIYKKNKKYMSLIHRLEKDLENFTKIKKDVYPESHKKFNIDELLSLSAKFFYDLSPSYFSLIETIAHSHTSVVEIEDNKKRAGHSIYKSDTNTTNIIIQDKCDYGKLIVLIHELSHNCANLKRNVTNSYYTELQSIYFQLTASEYFNDQFETNKFYNINLDYFMYLRELCQTLITIEKFLKIWKRKPYNENNKNYYENKLDIDIDIINDIINYNLETDLKYILSFLASVELMCENELKEEILYNSLFMEDKSIENILKLSKNVKSYLNRQYALVGGKK